MIDTSFRLEEDNCDSGRLTCIGQCDSIFCGLSCSMRILNIKKLKSISLTKLPKLLHKIDKEKLISLSVTQKENKRSHLPTSFPWAHLLQRCKVKVTFEDEKPRPVYKVKERFIDIWMKEY